MNKKEQEEQQPRFLIHFEGCGHQRVVDASTRMNPYESDPTMYRRNYHLCIHCFYEKRGRCEISLHHKAAAVIPLSQPKRRWLQQEEDSTIMTTNDNSDKNNITITTEERIKINVEYLDWLYAKSRERKKQNKGLLDTRRAIELVIRDAGGEKALKELFLKEQDEKIIDALSKLNPRIAETFKQDREAGLQALNGFIADLENDE